MDGTSLELPLFLLATFAGALVAGLSGFAFGLVASAIWLYILTPLQTATLSSHSGWSYRATRSGSCAARWTGENSGRL